MQLIEKHTVNSFGLLLSVDFTKERKNTHLLKYEPTTVNQSTKENRKIDNYMIINILYTIYTTYFGLLLVYFWLTLVYFWFTF
jgi:hypothetical protein